MNKYESQWERDIKLAKLNIAEGQLTLASIDWQEAMERAMPYIVESQMIPEGIREDLMLRRDNLMAARESAEAARREYFV